MDPYMRSIRKAQAGVREPRGAVQPDWQKGQTVNHEGAIVVGNYALDPQGPWRAELLKWLTNMFQVKGLICSRGGDELGSTSHKGHNYGWADACLYFALLNSDAEVLSLIMQIECGVHAVESLCVTPKGDIVMTGARCHYGDPKSADQREQGNRRWQWLEERKVRMPKLLATADDWIGLYMLTLVKQLPGGNNKLKQIAQSTTLPLLHNAITVDRTHKGHTVHMLSVDGCLRPALWAIADYATGEELYGCDPKWDQGYKEAKLGDVPLPRNAPQGGKVVTVRGIS